MKIRKVTQREMALEKQMLQAAKYLKRSEQCWKDFTSTDDEINGVDKMEEAFDCLIEAMIELDIYEYLPEAVTTYHD